MQKYIGKRIADGQEIEGYILKCEGNINKGKTYICPEVKHANILGLNGPLAELGFGPFYAVEPESVKPAPKRDKIRAKLAELEAEAEKYGAELQLFEDDFIDDEHLDCVWYGGEIGEIVYKGYVISIAVEGDVRISGAEGDAKFEDFAYVNKQGTGAYAAADDSLRMAFKNDDELQEAQSRERITYENNNWVEFFVKTPDGLWHDGDVIEFNVLEAFDSIATWLEMLRDSYGCHFPEAESDKA